MLGLNGSKPRLCLKVGAHALAWGERSTTWRGRHRYRCVLSPTPTGSIKLSPIEPNLIDKPTLVERLRMLAGHGTSVRFAGRVLVPEMPRSVILLMPDLAVRTMVLPLDHLPPRKDELEALIRWRLGQEQQLPLGGTKLTWQVFPPSQTADGSHLLLVVAVQQSILSQYESLCESVGLLPQEVGVSSVHLFNLWFKASGGYSRLGRDLACLTVLDGAMTCFIFHHGRPLFVRTKMLSGEGGADMTDDRAIADTILRETTASIVACEERHPGVHVKEVVLMGEEGGRHLEETLGNELGVTVDRLAWDHVHALGWSQSGGSASLSALPVIAAMIS